MVQKKIAGVCSCGKQSRADGRTRRGAAKSLRQMIRGLSIIHILCLAGRTNGANNFREEAKKFYQGFDKRMICVALDHDPAGIPEAVEAGMDLVLCGHTHKGQFFPSTLFTKWANGKDYFYGYMIFGKTHAVITSGAGFFQLPIRVATNHEVVSIFLE